MPEPHENAAERLLALGQELFVRADYAAAVAVLRLLRKVGTPEPHVVLLELTCRSALGEPDAVAMLEELGMRTLAAAWMPGGKQSATEHKELREAAYRFVPRVAPGGTSC